MIFFLPLPYAVGAAAVGKVKVCGSGLNLCMMSRYFPKAKDKKIIVTVPSDTETVDKWNNTIMA